jgi:hypothetical protein
MLFNFAIYGGDMNRIDLIIDALSVAQNSVWSKLNEQALAAARELQALKPVLWKSSGDAWFYEKPLFEATPLYALDEVAK